MRRIALLITGVFVFGAGAQAPELPPTLPISLPAALKLAGASPLEISIAAERLQAAIARCERAKVLWLPSIQFGADYARHDGQIQDIRGTVFNTSRSAVMVGAAPVAVFAVSEAIYAPLAAKQFVRARHAEVEVARADSVLAVAEAYFSVQQARGELAGALQALRLAEDVTRRVEQLAPALIPGLEVDRAKTELARRQQAVGGATERYKLASADLVELLRLDPTTIVEPCETPELRFEIVDTNRTVDELIPVALTCRPELAAGQAIVQATLVRLRNEKMRPLIPSLLLRGNATNPAGTLAGGYFGGGINGDLSNFGPRMSYDMQLIWEFQNLGFGNKASVKERAAENRHAVLELFRTQDRVAADVVRAVAGVQRATGRIPAAENGVRFALSGVDKSIEGMGQTKRAGELLVLVVRPQEAMAAVTSLEQAYRDLAGAIADANKSQFRLYRALGQPTHGILEAFYTQPNEGTKPIQPAAKIGP